MTQGIKVPFKCFQSDLDVSVVYCWTQYPGPVSRYSSLLLVQAQLNGFPWRDLGPGLPRQAYLSAVRGGNSWLHFSIEDQDAVQRWKRRGWIFHQVFSFLQGDCHFVFPPVDNGRNYAPLLRAGQPSFVFTLPPYKVSGYWLHKLYLILNSLVGHFYCPKSFVQNNWSHCNEFIHIGPCPIILNHRPAMHFKENNKHELASLRIGRETLFISLEFFSTCVTGRAGL